jgi:hypothetical protein
VVLDKHLLSTFSASELERAERVGHRLLGEEQCWWCTPTSGNLAINARARGARSRTDAEAMNKAMATRGEAGVAMNPSAAKEDVIREVSSWEGVSVHEHRFGGVEFRLERRELGHLHGSIADLPFPRRIRDELVATGRARPHHVLPNSGWVTVPMRTASQAAGVIELFRQSYERATSARR